MGVRFIIGRAGSGKSRYCLDSIVSMLRENPLGEPIYLIVPKQQTFTAERELTCASGLHGFCRARIVSFELLGEQVLAEMGGTAIPEVTPTGRQMIIGHLLRRHEDDLKFYRTSARQIGLAAELDHVFAEMENSGKGAVDLQNVRTDLQGGSENVPLQQKLGDLALLYSNYIAYLGQDRLDPHRRLEQVLASIQNSKQIRRATVFVDDFLELDEWQRLMLAAMVQVCRSIDITILMDPDSPILRDPHRLPDELSLFHRTEDTYRRLWFTFSQVGIEPDEPVKLQKVARFTNPSLNQIEQHLFAPRPVLCKAAQNLNLIEAPDRRAEVDAAARQVREYLEAGMRWRDVAVLVRDLEEYHALIDASFAEHRIPYFADRRRTAAHHPLLQFVRAALQIGLHDWARDAVMALLKTDLAGLSREQTDELENYVLQHRIRGGETWMSPEPWRYARKLTRGNEDEPVEPEIADLPQLDALRQALSRKLEPLVVLFKSKTPIPAKAIVLELVNTLERFDIRSSLRKWIEESSKLEQGGEHGQVWANLTELLDQLVGVIGDEPLTPFDFVSILETGLEQFDLALTPPTVDQVLVGAADRTRNLRARAVILLGMNDGQFPKRSAEDSILADHERQTLRKHRLEFGADSQRTLFDEHLLGYIALTGASSHLCLTRAISDDASRPQAPSPYWISLRHQFQSLAPIQVQRKEPSLDCIGTPRQLVTSLMQWTRHATQAGAEPSASADVWHFLCHLLATYPNRDDAIDTMRRQAWPALSYRNESNLSPAIARKLFVSPLAASVSQIETFAACPFQHFARYGLRLTRRDEEDVTAIDLGIACHWILEKLVSDALIKKAGWTDLALPQSRKMVHQLAQQIGQELRGELLMSSAHNQYLLEHIERTIDRVVDAQTAAGQRGAFVPWRTELPFGDNTKLGPLIVPTPGGNELRLRGKIDRVDKVRDDALFAVIDYKYRGDRLALDWVYHGLSLQLLTYLLVLQRNGSQLAKTKLTPVAALYVQLLQTLEDVKHPDDATPPDDPEFPLRIKPRGLIDFQHRQLLDAETGTQSSQSLQVYVNKDGALGRKNSSDACEPQEFAALLNLAAKKLAELGDRIIAGDISISPYRISGASPCAHCEYRNVCRFDVALNQYHILPAIKREEVLERALEEQS